MINVKFNSYCELEEGLGIINPKEFFKKIDDLDITVRNVMFENSFWKTEYKRKMKGHELEQIVQGLKYGGYDSPFIEIIKNDIDDELFIGLTLFDTYEEEFIKYEWVVM